MIEHPTFMYGDNSDSTTVILTWWIDGEQYALEQSVMIEDGLDKILATHQYLLGEFVAQVNKYQGQQKS